MFEVLAGRRIVKRSRWDRAPPAVTEAVRVFRARRNKLSPSRQSSINLLMSFLTFVCVAALSWTFAAARTDESPVVHVLVPGFTVQELPIQISNLNKLRFAPDGRLFALAYDGRIHILTDSDGDGLEDKDELFWDKPGLSVPVGMTLAAEGVYVSSHGKVSLFRPDATGRKAESEEIIATGWVATDVASGGVDAIGITRDDRANIYFGLIPADNSTPTPLKDGVPHYDPPAHPRTIQ